MLHQPIAAAGQGAVAHRPFATTRNFLLALAAVWLAGAALLCGIQAHAIATRDFPDPDDYLRLGEVRDWLAGQSFWDVSQHRVNMPVGGPMHWSRIVDAPIALFELLFRPLLGTIGAETAAAVIVPLLTLGVVMAAVATLGRRMAGAATGLVAAALLPTAVVTMAQFKPLRVDHHGWEIAFSLIAFAGALSGGRRGGLVAGVAIAAALQVSLEQLPFAVALGGLIGGTWILDPRPDAARRLVHFLLSLGLTETGLAVALHGPAFQVVHCDGVSPPHLLALAVAAVGGVACVAMAPASALCRAAGLGATALLAAAAFHALPPHCGLDPFSELGPFEKHFWLDHVPEGLPVWRSGLSTSVFATGFPLVGLAGCLMAARAGRGERRVLWLRYGAVLAAATVLGVLVLRAASLSNAIATVPGAWLMIAAVRRTRASGRATVRVLGSAAAILGLGPLAPGVVALSVLPQARAEDPAAAKGRAACRNPATWRDLNALPPSRIMASIDVGPQILLGTHHAVLATGHHRNHVAIADELRAWMGSDTAAARIVRAHGIDYLLICPALDETDVYATTAPRGLSARLMRGEAPAWLRPMPLPGSSARLWRVLPQPPAGSPSSRSAGGAVPTPVQISRSADFSPSS